MNILQKEYQSFLKRFEPVFKKTLETYQKELEQIYPKNLFSYFREFALRPSKRLRPFLVYLGYRFGGGKSLTQALRLGVALEIFHSSILIQDDIADRSLLRRGGSTLHQQIFTTYKTHHDALHYAESTSMNVAILGYHLAFHHIFALQNKEVEKQFRIMIGETVVGQQIDTDLPFLKQYHAIKKMNLVLCLKSGRYSIDRPLALGLALAGKSKWISAFLEFSNPLGSVFQATDDYLGIFGEEKELGKSTDSDLKEGKATLVIYYGLRNATRSERKKILNVLGNQSAAKREIKEVKAILKPYVEKPIKTYIEQKASNSISQLTRLPISKFYKTLFRELIEYLKSRKK